jgi:amiloride-sensitive sodium channel
MKATSLMKSKCQLLQKYLIIVSCRLQKFSDVSLICDNHLHKTGNKTTSFKTIEYLIDVRNFEIVDNICISSLFSSQIAPPFSEVFFSCKWTSMNETCDHLFSPMLTEDGICFTFNMLDRSEFFTNAV